MTDRTRMPTVTSLAVVRRAKLPAPGFPGENVTYGVTLDDGTYFTVRGVRDATALMPGRQLDFRLSATVDLPDQGSVEVHLGKLPSPAVAIHIDGGDPHAMGRAVAGELAWRARTG